MCLRRHRRSRRRHAANCCVGPQFYVIFRYVIEHIEGVHNVWADMVSRWASPTDVQFKRVTRGQARTATLPLLRPLDDAGFVWPTLEELRQVQRAYPSQRPTAAALGENDVYQVSDRIWIPSEASSLLQRLFIISHCGAQGHRGEETMLSHLRDIFSIAHVEQLVRKFLRSCLICLQTKGGRVIPRPYGPLIRASSRNEILHWDFLTLDDTYENERYVLVLKDNATHYSEMTACSSPTSQLLRNRSWRGKQIRMRRFGLVIKVHTSQAR